MVPEKQRSRFTYFGFCGRQSLITYDLATRTVAVGEQKAILESGRTFFDYMRDLLNSRTTVDDPTLPFSMQGGLVGYLGYEMGLESGMAYRLKSDSVVGFGETPDAAFVLAEKLVVLDMLDKNAYVVAVRLESADGSREENGADADPIAKWMDNVTELMLQQAKGFAKVEFSGDSVSDFFLQHDYQSYMEKIEACRQQIRDGESYELCLTNKIMSLRRPDDALKYPQPLHCSDKT